MSNTVSETTLINSNVLAIYNHCLALVDELLSKHNPEKIESLFMTNVIYHVRYREKAKGEVKNLRERAL